MKIQSLHELQDAFGLSSSSSPANPSNIENIDSHNPLKLLAVNDKTYQDANAESKDRVLNFMLEVCRKTAVLVAGGDEAGANAIMNDLLASKALATNNNNNNNIVATGGISSNHRQEPLVEPDYDEYDAKLQFSQVHNSSSENQEDLQDISCSNTQSLEDVILRAMLCASKATAEYRTLRSVLCQVYSKKDINEMLKKWKVVEDISELDNLQELEKRGNKRLRINVDEFRTALQDYSILTASHNVSEHETQPRKRRKDHLEGMTTASSDGGGVVPSAGGMVPQNAVTSASHPPRGTRRGIAPRFKNMLLAEFIRRLGNFTISEAVHWLKQCMNEADVDFPTDKQIRGYISILRMNNKKTGEIPVMVEEE